ncbi:hypothetical protein, partial [Roseimaritima sediminicola]|uniref:hypothetical protein n=1 Tax=Roseimaritima sediminicola TaxID=2662066 RepID=UPI001F24E4CE
ITKICCLLALESISTRLNLKMTETKQRLIKKLLGLIQSIETMTNEEKTSYPTDAFGDDYNRLRSMVIESEPELERFMPPEVEVYESAGMGRLTTQKFGEIHVFSSQIYQLLS